MPGPSAVAAARPENRSGMDSYTGHADRDQAKARVVVGGGFIGFEMVENLVQRGLEVTLVEKLDQVMPPLDSEMARSRTLPVQARRQGGARVMAWPGSRKWPTVAGGPHECREERPGGDRHPGDRRAAGDRAGEDGRNRDRSARRDPRRRAHAHERPRHLRRGRRRRGEGLRHRPVDAHPARRAGQPAGPNRGRRDRRTDSRYRGTQGTSICKIFEAAIGQTGRQREGPQAVGDTDFRRTTFIQIARGLLPGRQDDRHQGPLPKSDGRLGRTGARRSWRREEDRCLCDGDPDGRRLRP